MDRVETVVETRSICTTSTVLRVVRRVVQYGPSHGGRALSYCTARSVVASRVPDTEYGGVPWLAQTGYTCTWPWSVHGQVPDLGLVYSASVRYLIDLGLVYSASVNKYTSYLEL